VRCGSPFFLLLKLAFFLFNRDTFIVFLLPITLDLTLSPTVGLLIAATPRVSSLKVVLLHILDEEIAHSPTIQVNILTLLKHFIKLDK